VHVTRQSHQLSSAVAAGAAQVRDPLLVARTIFCRMWCPLVRRCRRVRRTYVPQTPGADLRVRAATLRRLDHRARQRYGLQLLHDVVEAVFNRRYAGEEPADAPAYTCIAVPRAIEGRTSHMAVQHLVFCLCIILSQTSHLRWVLNIGSWSGSGSRHGHGWLGFGLRFSVAHQRRGRDEVRVGR